MQLPNVSTLSNLRNVENLFQKQSEDQKAEQSDVILARDIFMVFLNLLGDKFLLVYLVG